MSRRIMVLSAVLVAILFSFAGVSMVSADSDAISDSSEPVILTDGGSGGQASNPVSDLTHFNSLESELRIFDILENTRTIYAYVGTPVAILTSSFSTVCYGFYFVTDGFGLSISGDAVHESCPDSKELHGTISKAGDFALFYYQTMFDSDGDVSNRISGSIKIHAVEMAEPDDGGDTPIDPDPDEDPDDKPGSDGDSDSDVPSVDPDPDDSGDSESPGDLPTSDGVLSPGEDSGSDGISLLIPVLALVFVVGLLAVGVRRR